MAFSNSNARRRVERILGVRQQTAAVDPISVPVQKGIARAHLPIRSRPPAGARRGIDDVRERTEHPRDVT